MKLKLPELKRPSLPSGARKGPNLRVPTFLADLYYDLRDRRLLPVVALVVVAIAAVPFLLGDEAEPLPPPSATSGGEISPESGEASFTVVEANPGLRDYRKRLKGRTPTDPFAKSAPASSGGGGGEGDAGAEGQASSAVSDGSGSPSSSSPSESPSSSPPAAAGGGEAEKPSSPASPPSSGGGSSSPDDLDGRSLFGFRPDVRFGVAGSGKLSLHEELPLGSLLPKQNAVVLFVGVTQNGERALFSVGPDVVVRGDGGCVGGDENCRFLSMRAGDAVDLLTPSGKSFRLKVESIEFVELEVPPKSEQASGSAAAETKHRLAPVFR